MKKRILCLVSVLCLLLGIFGAASAEVDGLKKIGFACMKNDPFMVPLCNGMQEVCDANGIELIVYYADNDIEKQISQCDDLLQQNIDGLIVMPVDFEGITPALDAAAKAGVPVVSVDAACADAEKTIAYIASDNFKAGQLCGEHLLATKDSAKILVLSHPEIKCTIDRLAGFKAALEGHDGYEILSEQPSSGLYDKGMAIMDNWLQQFSDFDVVFAINDGSLQGAIASMQAANRLEGVQTYAVDGQQQMADYIKEGLQTAEAAQNPYAMGQGAVELLIKNAKGEPFEYENLLDVTLLTKDNVDGYVGF
ncbi:MAG: substrate-binding domain-containing protein [Clostridiales bacterium]|nr:substrate-binding domain-containing protein [Clostridiales bacterium]